MPIAPNNILKPTQLSAAELAVSQDFANDGRPHTIQVNIGDLASGVTGTTTVANLYVHQSTLLGATGAALVCTDMQTGSGFTGGVVSADDVLGGYQRQISIPAGSPATYPHINVLAKGVTGLPCVSVTVLR